eukprot:gene12235-biopygen7557
MQQVSTTAAASLAKFKVGDQAGIILSVCPSVRNPQCITPAETAVLVPVEGLQKGVVQGGLWLWDTVRSYIHTPGVHTVTIATAHSARRCDNPPHVCVNQTDQYIASGGGRMEEYEPRFTWHGFRYVRLTGCPQPGLNNSTREYFT